MADITDYLIHRISTLRNRNPLATIIVGGDINRNGQVLTKHLTEQGFDALIPPSVNTMCELTVLHRGHGSHNDQIFTNAKSMAIVNKYDSKFSDHANLTATLILSTVTQEAELIRILPKQTTKAMILEMQRKPAFQSMLKNGHINILLKPVKDYVQQLIQAQEVIPSETMKKPSTYTLEHVDDEKSIALQYANGNAKRISVIDKMKTENAS